MLCNLRIEAGLVLLFMLFSPVLLSSPCQIKYKATQFTNQAPIVKIPIKFPTERRKISSRKELMFWSNK